MSAICGQAAFCKFCSILIFAISVSVVIVLSLCQLVIHSIFVARNSDTSSCDTHSFICENQFSILKAALSLFLPIGGIDNEIIALVIFSLSLLIFLTLWVV